MVTLRSTMPCSRQTPTKRIRDIEVIIIDSDSAESEAEEPKVTTVCRREHNDEEHELFCYKRRTFSSPASRRLSVVPSDEEEAEFFCHKRRSFASPTSRRLSVVSSDEEDNAHKDETMAVSARIRMTQSCMPSLRAASNNMDDVKEPTGRRRLFRLSTSPLIEKKMHMQDKGTENDFARAISAEPHANREEGASANMKVRRRLKCSSSSSSAEATSTIETDTDNMPIGRRLLLRKSEEFSTATSPPTRSIITRVAESVEAIENALDRLQEKLSSSSLLSPGHVCAREALPSISPGTNICRDIIPLCIDRPLIVASKQNVPSGIDVTAAKRVKDTLRLFNSYFLRCVQEEETRCRKEAEERAKNRSKEPRLSRRPDLKAISQMKDDDKLGYDGKIIGPVPGITIGDQFFSRCEMVAIGLHCHWLGGIDTIPATYKKKLGIARLPVASSIVLSGNYEDDIDNSEDVIYTGSGGNDLLGNKRQIADQVLKRGNLALKNNMEQGLPVRLVRGHKTKKSYTGKVYTYDGLYRVNDFWAEEGISGFTVYKYRLKRVEGQPLLTTNQVHFVSGHDIPASITELKGLVCPDISNGLESIAVPATNIHSPPFAPNDFKYITQTKVQKGVQKPIPAKGCNCEGECFDPHKCSCAIRNNRRFPYVTQNGGRLVEPMDVVYECGPHCACGQSCSNRVTQKGMQYRLELHPRPGPSVWASIRMCWQRCSLILVLNLLCGPRYEYVFLPLWLVFSVTISPLSASLPWHLKVFRTANKGWGVRSWDTIPAGAPVCQYFGVLMRTEEADDICDNEFIFELDCLQTIKGIGGRQRRLISNGDKMGLEDDPVANAPEQPEYCIDAGSCGSVSRLINHSCDPNLFVQCVLNDHHDLSQPRIWFFAAETIRPLQELSYDYGYALDSVVKNGKVKVLPCYCGAHNCRKRLH